MGYFTGRVSEIRIGAGRRREACITCSPGAIPSAGQYLLVCDEDDQDAPLSVPVFNIGSSNQGFWAAPQFPVSWEPGTMLHLIGPLGHGFDLPRNIQRLGLVALGETVSRLLPLVHLASQTRAGMTLFTNLALPQLPAALEVSPLGALPNALEWPDFLALDVPQEAIQQLRTCFGISDQDVLPCPAQVLVTAPMPCAGMAQCGACALPARRGWKLVCEDGPVFDLRELKW